MKIELFVLVLLSVFSTRCNAQNLSEKKILVVYFSHSGNTRFVAEQIQKVTNADIFEIQPVNAYPKDYNTVVDQAQKEIHANFKPVLKTQVKNIESYDVIFVGSPNWWNTLAPPVATFLTSYDLSGKTIVPFMTHGGSGLGNSEDDIKKYCPKSKVFDGLAIRDNALNTTEKKVEKWLKELKVSR